MRAHRHGRVVIEPTCRMRYGKQMISVRYFAGIREQLGRDQDSLEADGKNLSVAELWTLAVGESWPERLMVAVNQRLGSPRSRVQDGDEVAFFPPVTGG